MVISPSGTSVPFAAWWTYPRWVWVLLGLVLICGLLSGCASLTNPVAEGVPVRRLPPEFLGKPREIERPIPLALLGQPAPNPYRVGPGDILGIWVEGVEGLSQPGQLPPVRAPVNGTPALGLPIPVRSDGTLGLPYVESVPIKGMSLTEVEQALRYAYTVKKQILKPGKDRIIVTLMERRTYHVLVVREDGGGASVGANGAIGVSKRGSGQSLELPAYENDVLNALTRTGGLPGLEATNDVFIEVSRASTQPGQTIRIPLRLPDGARVPFSPEDVLLHDGDVVRIMARDRELWYTAGILGSVERTLPRDYDLDVLTAILQAGGNILNGNQGQSGLSGQTTSSGLGAPNPSQVSIVRRTSDGRQLTIRVDLNRAFQDRRERILIQPGDIVVLQYTVGEAILNYVSGKIDFAFAARIFKTNNPSLTTAFTVP